MPGRPIVRAIAPAPTHPGPPPDREHYVPRDVIAALPADHRGRVAPPSPGDGEWNYLLRDEADYDRDVAAHAERMAAYEAARRAAERTGDLILKGGDLARVTGNPARAPPADRPRSAHRRRS